MLQWRWQVLFDELIANLATETPGEGLRINMDHKVREAETSASNLAAPATLAEKSVHRKREPLCANKRCWLMIWHSRLLFGRESLPGTRIGGAKEINEGA